MTFIKNISVELPSTYLSNDDLIKKNPTWNIEKASINTGVYKRGICSNKETAIDLGVLAVEKIFKNSDLNAENVDGIIFCTQSPDYIMPNNASIIHSKFNFRENIMAFDINLACSGFVYSVGIASSLLNNDKCKDVLAICGDTYSKFISPNDRSTKLLFGDGVACIHISKTPSGFHVIDTEYYTNGENGNRFILKNGGARNQQREINSSINMKNEKTSNDPNFIEMDGIGILTFFNTKVPESILSILKKNNLSIKDVKYIVPHQASKIATDGIKKSLKIDDSKFYFNIESTGNITSASIPQALSQLKDENKIMKGDYVVCCGFGVGLSWATSLLHLK
jgi:3-oxoacyl-[acyl-carrier-protein] synthase-3